MKTKKLVSKLILLLIVSLFLVSCQSAKIKPTLANEIHLSTIDTLITYKDTDWKKANLSSYVKSIQETSTVEYKGEKPKVTTAKSDFTTFGKYVFSDYQGHVFKYKYNSKEQVIERREYMSGNLINKDIYAYSSDGKKTSKSRYQSPTFSSEEEWEAHEAKIHSLPNEGLYLQSKRLFHDNGNESVTIYKENSQVEYLIDEVHDEKSRIVEFKATYPFSEAFGYKKTWEYDDYDNLVKFKKYNGPKNNLDWVFEYEYDKDKRIIKKTALHYMPKSSSTMNKNGHLKEQTYGHVLAEEMSGITTYEYDTNGRKTSEVRKIYNGEITHEITYENTYDDHQNIIHEKVIDSKKGLRINEVKYDDNGNEIFYKSVDGDGNLITKVIKTFDEDSNLTSRVDYSSDGSINKEETFTYDDKANVVLHKIRKPQEKAIEIESHEYDDHGNWIKFIHQSRSTETEEIFFTITKEREITYFEY